MVTSIQKGKSNLRPRAKLIKTIGEELISNDTIAILELVKNSYDADATEVTIIFKGPLVKGQGSIIIEDNGTGMDLDTIKNAWMEPATNFKIIRRKSGKGRKILGEKGIGRFASAKLADQLIINTKIKSDNEIHAIFNWEDFSKTEKYLDEIDCSWEVRKPKKIHKCGTILELRRLAADWDYHRFRELTVALSRLINPVAPIADFKIKLILPENKKFDKISGEIKPPDTLGKPDYLIKGQMNKKGKLIATYRSKKRRKEVQMSDNIRLKSSVILKKLNDTSRIPDCGKFSFEFRVWNREQSSIENLAKEYNSTVRDIKRDLNEAAGLSIYRDNFRVLPYGEPKNDWLRLDFRRVQNPTKNLSNNQIVGYIAISLDTNIELTDQSNREGIIDSQAFSDLKECIVFILSLLEIRRYKERRDSEYDDGKKKNLFTVFDLSPVVEIVKKKLPKDKEVSRIIKETDNKIKEGVKNVQEVLSRYRRLSTLGQLLDVVLHDGNNTMYTIDTQTTLLEKELNKKVLVEKNVKKHLQSIQNENKTLSMLFKRLEPFSGRKKGRPKQIILEEALENVFELHKYIIDKLDIDIELPTSTTSVRLDESEFEQIIVNLLQNSLYWLEMEKNKKKKIIVEVEKNDNELIVIFSDNGCGVKEEDIQYIFDPYFSTKPNGVGLGLTIVGELVTEYNGTLDLVDTGPLDGATFKITFKKRI
jgi:signal transduction histidine kinase